MKANISSYHMKGPVYEAESHRSKKCRMGVRDKRPVPNLVFPIDEKLRAEERQRKLEAKAVELKAQELEAEARRLREEAMRMVG